jgi:site-specific DNA recombinase
MDTDADVIAEGNSIDAQRKACQDKERAMGLVNVGEYVEPGHSAQTIEKRPVFREMMARILEQRDADYVIIYARSRAFRNLAGAMLETCGSAGKGLDVKEGVPSR